MFESFRNVLCGARKIVIRDGWGDCTADILLTELAIIAGYTLTVKIPETFRE